jgi:hypothetical protein
MKKKREEIKQLKGRPVTFFQSNYATRSNYEGSAMEGGKTILANDCTILQKLCVRRADKKQRG